MVAAAMALGGAAAATPASTLQYVIETIAGCGLGLDGGPAMAAQFGYVQTPQGVPSGPQGVATDRLGNLYVSDTYNHQVSKITPAGLLTVIAGNGYPGMRGDGGPGPSAQLNRPYGLAVGPAGNVYVADLGNHRVRCIRPDGVITTVAGTGEKGSRVEPGGLATEAQLMSPRNVALDAAGNLYIAEFEGHRVRKVTPAGIISTVAGMGVAGFGGDGHEAIKAQLDSPAGLAISRDGYLYIADSRNQRIRRVSPDGNITTLVIPSNIYATPVGLALDATGRLYITELFSVEIPRFFSSGRFDRNITGGHESGLLSPADVALDTLGNLYIADGPYIRRLGVTGALDTVAGDDYMRHIGDNGPATAAQLNKPMGLAMDIPGNLYIADSGTNRVRKITSSGIVTTVAGSGPAGFGGDGGAAVEALLNAPGGVAVDAWGSLFIADTGSNRIRVRDAAGILLTVAGNDGSGTSAEGDLGLLTPLHAPLGVAVGPHGSLYVADTAKSRVMVQNALGVMTTAAGNATEGYAGDGGGAPLAQLNQPGALAADAAGNLFIADTMNHAIRKVDPDGNITTAAGNGAEGSTGDGGPAVAAALSRPRGVAVDGDGCLYIADTGNHAVRKVTPDGIIHTIAGNGTEGFGGDGGPAVAAMLDAPWGVLVDGSAHVYVSDSLNHRVRRLTPAPQPPDEQGLAEPRVVNSASLLAGVVAPGEVIMLFGAGLGPSEGRPGLWDGLGKLATEAWETQVLFDGVPAPLFYVQESSITAQVPYTVIGRGTTTVEVRYRQEPRARTVLPVMQAAPAIYTMGGGQGQALALNEDGSLNSESTPAARGSVVTLWATGEGQTNPAGTDGAPATIPYPKPILPVSLTVAGIEADLLYARAAPGLVGVMQINARIPRGFAPIGMLPLELMVAGVKSQGGVTVAVR